MVAETVLLKLRFAKCRLDDLAGLIAENRFAVDADLRQQLSQEFFFHLVGATEYVAQLVNARRSLGLDRTRVAAWRVAEKINPLDQLWEHLERLSPDPNKKLFPDDPYSEDGLIYRTINYRNEVVHRNTNPFHFILSAGPQVAFFHLDPRDPERGISSVPISQDLASMFFAIESRCQSVLSLLDLIPPATQLAE